MTAPRIVLITGASGGIGLELARLFAAEGAVLVLTGRDREKLAAASDELRRDHQATVATFVAELGEEDGITALLAGLAAASLEVDVLVNNAGHGLHGDFQSTDSAADLALTTVHVHAPLRLTKALLPGMVRRGRGGVLNVGSLYSFAPAPWQSLYGAAKGWVLSFSLALREELSGTGVTVTALCPGTTLSAFRTRSGYRDRASWHTLTPAEVAAAGYRGFTTDRAVVVPGFANKLFLLGTRLLPTGWLARYVYLAAYRVRRMPAVPHAKEKNP
jgi:short-subunit dehydrogenase